MNALPKMMASAVALCGLLAGAASHATDVATLPLKASVLAKPNVIFGMDDSGSMDWEALLDTSSGAFWWNGATGWDAGQGKPLATSGMVPYVYLFPVGTAAGGQLYAFNSWWGQAVPPTNQFAWLRSPRFHSVYYNSLTDYPRWAPAYVDGALRNYPDAVATAALSHPAYPAGPSLDLTDDWNAGDANFATNGFRFYVQAGMTVPAGSFVSAGSATTNVCNGGAQKTLTADVVVAAGRACWASIPYFPATFWHAENCVAGPDCVVGPDGVTTLKRHEIKPGNNFPSGRTYAAEIQNFANWFTYYRKRKLMLAASMGAVLEPLTGLRIGLMPFTDANVATPVVTMYDTDNTDAANNGRRVAGAFYKNALAAQGTPTHATVKHIAKQFDENTNIVKYACQRNSMFIVTDGFSNTTTITPPNWDAGKSAATWGAAAPYQATTDGTLADLALRYYTNRLRDSGGTALAAGKVPPSSSPGPNADVNPDLHINTYAISLGVRGSLWPTAVDPFVTPPAWVAPVANDPSLIDDQWHATINGRGLMYLATDPAETTAGINAVLQDIVSQTGAQGGIAVSTINLGRGDSRAYFGTYNPAGWAGDLTANPVDPVTGVIDTANSAWSASAKLSARDWTTRVIASANAGGGIGFTVADVAATVNPGGIYGADADVIGYLRGNRTLEGTALRQRSGLMGAVINSEPAVDRDNGVAYVQSGEGMLHAIDTKDPNAGEELWAFVPRTVLGSIGETAKRGYVFHTLLDGSPVVVKTGAASRLLVAGMGAAGRSFHALDVSSPRGLTEAALAGKFSWEFPAAADAATQAKMGLALGKPVIVNAGADGWVVLLTSGYNSSADHKGRLWMVNASTGAIIHEFVTTDGAAGAEAGLAQVTAFGESNGTVQYVYGGDLLGNVWRFDLVTKDAPFKLAQLRNAAGQVQPVTAAPELLWHEGKRLIIVGTGRLLDISDFGNPNVQSIYAIADGAYLPNARAGLVQQVYTRGADPEVTSNPVDWTSDRGWYMDIPAGEQINTRPRLAYNAITFVSNVNGQTDCSASSYFYVLDLNSGSTYTDPNGNTVAVTRVISATANSSGTTSLRTINGKVVGSGQTSDGEPWKEDVISESPVNPAKNAWREIRR